MLRKYSLLILDVFSNTEGISLNSIKVLSLVLFVGSVASIAFYSINPIKVFGNYIVLIIPLAIISFAIWLLGIVGLRKKMLQHEFPVIISNIGKKELPPNEKLFNNLVAYFEKEKPFLNPDLKIDDLILELTTNRTLLSNAINLYSGKNFNKFVNDYRIEYAKGLIAQSKEEIIKDEVATKSGFGSIRTFERNFKECVGESFTQYSNHAEY